MEYLKDYKMIASLPQGYIAGRMAIMEDGLLLGRHHCHRKWSSEQMDLAYDNYQEWYLTHSQ